MTAIVTYVCNFCKHEQTTPDKPRQMYELGFNIKKLPNAYSNGGRFVNKTAHTCDKCAGDRLLFVAEKDPPAQPTLEDFIREIAQEEAAEVYKNRS
jgi:hypothetical protein